MLSSRCWLVHFEWTIVLIYLCLFYCSHPLNFKTNGIKLPNGVVKYKFDTSLSLKDVSEFKKRFRIPESGLSRQNLYHWEDIDFVNFTLRNDDTIFANVCKLGGNQPLLQGKLHRKSLVQYNRLDMFSACIMSMNEETLSCQNNQDRFWFSTR